MKRKIPFFLVFILLFTITLSYQPDVKAQEFPHIEAEKTISPQRVHTDETVTVTITLTGAGGMILTPVDVFLILDRSGSMIGQKIKDAKAAATTFLNYTDTKDRIGLITYSNKARVDYSLLFMNSTNKEALKTKIDAYEAFDATNIYEALVTGKDLLLTAPRIQAPLVMILLTDGLHNYPSQLPDSEFIALAEDAKNNHIIIYTIGVGADVNAARLQLIAETTNGQYFFAPNSTALQGIFEEIGSMLAFAGTNIKVTETIPSYLTYNGDASQPVNETITDGDDTLIWDVGSLKVGDEWTVTYTAQAGEAVESSSSVIQCMVEYITSEAASAVINLPPGLIYHNVAVTSFIAEPDTVTQGDLINITATVENRGVTQDTCTVEIQYDNTTIHSQSITLDQNQMSNITFSWNTSDVEPRAYNVTVIVDPDDAIWEEDKMDNRARQEIQITQPIIPDNLIYFLIIFIIIIMTMMGAAYYKLRPQPSFPSQPQCSHCGGPLLFDTRTRRWYCPHCRR